MAANGQQSLWLSAALVQAGLPSYIAEASAWMSSEQAIVADFCRDNTISDLGKALKLTNTQLQRLRSKIDALGPDTIPLPELDVSLRDKSSEEDVDDTANWRPPSLTVPDQNRSSAPPLLFMAPPAPDMQPPPVTDAGLRL